LKITIIIEGETEDAFIPILREFLKKRLPNNMPRLDPLPYYGRIPKEEKLKRVVQNVLNGPNASDHVIALTDIYTGSTPPDFISAQDAKNKMRQWVGATARFHAHVAQHDFEAWLIPYWKTIQKLSGSNRKQPSANPETINHNNPPAHRLIEVFEAGKCRDSYNKPRDGSRILRENDLSVSINQCSELKAFVNTILSVSGGQIIP
jgi:hypothetical protein